MAEQYIEDVLNEIKKFNTHIKNIGDALISKNIQT